VLCPGCSAGERCRLREKDVLYLQDIMRRGLKSLDSDAVCTDELFAALRSLAEGRLDIPIRSGKMLL